jgi:hypothetical protein
LPYRIRICTKWSCWAVNSCPIAIARKWLNVCHETKANFFLKILFSTWNMVWTRRQSSPESLISLNFDCEWNENMMKTLIKCLLSAAHVPQMVLLCNELKMGRVRFYSHCISTDEFGRVLGIRGMRDRCHMSAR